jgi:uncharacterized protein YfaS (alpha-2-macroglobulin family)
MIRRTFYLSILLYASLASAQVLESFHLLTVNDVEVVQNNDQLALEITFSRTAKDNVFLNLFSDDKKKDSEATPHFNEILLSSAIKINPDVAFTAKNSKNGIILLGHFLPQTEYILEINDHLQDLLGFALKKTFRKTILTGDLKPHFRFLNKARFLPPQLQHKIQYESVNTEEVEITFRQIYQQNIHQLFSNPNSITNNLSDIIKTQNLDTRSLKNKTNRGFVSFENIKTLGEGIFYLEARDSNEGFLDSSLIIITELGSIIKLGANNSLKIWTFKNTDLKPISNVEVSLNSESNYKLGSCKTKGPKAYCEIKWPKTSKKPFALSLKKAKDQSYLRLSDLEISNPMSEALRPYNLRETQELDAFIFNHRNVYRLGETIYLGALIRNTQGNASKNSNVQWRITNPKGQIFRQTFDKTTDLGFIYLEFPTFHTYSEGDYVFELRYAEKTIHTVRIKLETYIPEYLDTTLKAEKETQLGLLKAKFFLNAKNKFKGEPSAIEYEIQCLIEEAQTHLPSSEDFKTGTYQLVGQNKITVDTIKGNSKTGKSIPFFCDFQKFANQLPKTVYKITARAKVGELGNPLNISAVASSLISLTNTNIGIRARQNLEENWVELEGAITDVNNKILTESRQIRVDLVQIQENWIAPVADPEKKNQWQILESANTHSVTKPVESKNGKFSATLAPPIGWKKWIVKATDINTHATSELLMSSLLHTNELGPSEILKIEVDKQEITAGEKLTAKITPPFKGELLLSIESSMVHETQWIHIDHLSPQTLSFSAPNVQNNFYVTGLLIKNPISRNNKYISPRAWGALSVRIAPKKQVLNLQMEIPKNLQSGINYKFKIKNREKVRAEYSVLVTDERFFSESHHDPKSPLNRFLDPRALNAKTYESLNVTNSVTEFSKDSGNTIKNYAPIQGSLNRQHDRYFEFHLPKIQSNTKGDAEFIFTAPDIQGQFNFYIIGSSAQQVGSSSTSILVSNPLFLNMLLPDYFTQNDQTDLEFITKNSTQGTINLAVSLNTLGPIEINKTHWQLKVNPDEVIKLKEPIKILDFPVSIALEFKKQASANQFYNDSHTVPVFSNGVEKSLLFTTKAKEKLNLITALPPIWRKNHLNIHLQLSNFQYLGSFAHLNQLWNSTHSSLEHQVAKIFPLIGNEDLLLLNSNSQTALKMNVALVKQQVQKIIDSIFDQQCSDGGFTLWPNQDTSHPWGTAFAALALVEAKKQGYRISEHSYGLLIDYITLKTKNIFKDWQWFENEHPEFMINLLVLKQAKKNIDQNLGVIFKNNTEFKQKNIEDFAYENLFLFGLYARLQNYNPLAQKIFKDKTINSKVITEPATQTAFSAKNFWSPLRNDGLKLGLLLEYWPEHPAIKILSERIYSLLSQPNAFFSSQDLSWTLWAMGKLLRKTKITGEQIKNASLNFNSNTRLPDFFVRGIPVWNFSGDDLISSSFAFPQYENSNLIFHTSVSGFTMSPPPSLSPITVERAYLLPNGNEADETELQVGDKLIVELKIFIPRSIPFRVVAIKDFIPAGFEVEHSGPALEFSPWMSKDLVKVDHVELRQNYLQIFGEMKDSEKYYYYHVRARRPGKFKAPATLLELMYLPESFDFSSENTVTIHEDRLQH